MSNWKVVVPEAATNYVLNPGAEADGNYSAWNGATVTRDTTYARFGVWSYKIVTGAVNRGIDLTLSALIGLGNYFTFYVYKATAITGSLEVTVNGADYYAASVLGGALGGWIRYGVGIPIASGETDLVIRSTTSQTFYIDGVQAEIADGATVAPPTYYTTYVDGDQPGAFIGAYKWNGLRHGSTSTRHAQERGGGRERDLQTDYGAKVLQMPGAGMPPVTNNFQPLALRPGAIFQNAKVGSRSLTLLTDAHGTTLAGLHSNRNDLINILRGDAKRGAQPVTLGYTGANTSRTVYSKFIYDDGFQLGEISGGANWIEAQGRIPIRMIGADPDWLEDDAETAILTDTSSITGAYGNRRTSGQWLSPGTGFNGSVSGIAVDKVRGRVYFIGSFTTANGVTVNRVTYWNGSTFVAMGATPGVAGGAPTSIALAPNGDVWICGPFTSAGGATTDGLARWNTSASTWTVFASLNPTSGSITGLVVNSANVLYVGGDFLNLNGDAAQDYIAQFTVSTTTWAAVGTSPFAAGDYPGSGAVKVDQDDVLWVGSVASGGATAKLRSWDGSSWTTVLAGDANVSISLVVVGPDGRIALGGTFTTLGGVSCSRIAFYTGSSAEPLGDGVNGTVLDIVFTGSQSLVAVGAFTTAGGLALADRLAGWNGSSWYHLDIDLPGSPTVYAIGEWQGDLFIGYTTTGSATAAGITTVTNNGTAITYPKLTIAWNSMSAEVVVTITFLENQTTGQRVYLNLSLRNTETAEIDFANNSIVVSDWRGVVSDAILSASDEFYLLPGANTIAFYDTLGNSHIYPILSWQKRHASVDGVA